MIDFIVAAHNAALTIERCVRSISHIDASKTISVVDNGSTDKTTTILTTLKSELNLDLNHYTTSFKSKARAANLAYRLTSAPIVCSVDADVVFVEDRFREILTFLPDYDFLILTDNSENSKPLRVGLDNSFMPPRNSFLTTRNILGHSIFSPIYPKCGGEDLDLMLRLLKRGVHAGCVYGGYEHLRKTIQMGYRRRIHFHIWNLITYIKHADVQYCRQRLAYLATHPLAHLAASLKQESSQGLSHDLLQQDSAITNRADQPEQDK